MSETDQFCRQLIKGTPVLLADKIKMCWVHALEFADRQHLDS